MDRWKISEGVLMNKDPFKEYIKQTEPSKRDKEKKIYLEKAMLKN